MNRLYIVLFYLQENLIRFTELNVSRKGRVKILSVSTGAHLPPNMSTRPHTRDKFVSNK